MNAPYVTDWRIARELTRCLPDHLSTAARLIYLLIAGHLDKNGAAWPGHDQLRQESGLHVKTVWRCVRELRESGLIAVTSGVGTTTSVYRLIDFRLSTLSAPTRRQVSAPARSGLRASATQVSASTRTKEVIEEEREERACDCGNACPPGKWRCTDCQDQQAQLADAKVALLLRWRDRPVQ